MTTLIREQHMPYVKVKTKGQVTIPAEFRRDLNLKEGDLLEAFVEREGILLKPKTVVDRYDEQWAQNVLKEAEEDGKRRPKIPAEEDAEERRLLDLGAARTRCQAKAALFEYIEVFYNRHRRHSSVGYRTPAQARVDMIMADAA